MNGKNDQHSNSPRGDSSTWELGNAPQAKPPTLAAVAGEVKRRRRQNAYNFVTIALVLLCCGVGVTRWLDDGTNSPGDPAIAFAPQDSSADDLTVPRPGPTSPLNPNPTSPSGFTLYADIHSHAPVFQYDDRRDAMVPVGWVRSTDTVPVDLRGFSPDRMERFRNLLLEETDKTVY